MPPIHYTLSSWGKNLLSWDFIRAVLEVFGALWLSVEITAFFSQLASEVIKNYWYLFLAAGVIYAPAKCKPKLKVSCRLNNRDAVIGVAIGNIFDLSGALVVGSNTTFDTDISRGLISPTSIQGQYTSRYYQNVQQLDIELQQSLQGFPYEELSGTRLGKRRRYPMGTVLKLMPKDTTACFVAIAHMNEHGNAYGATFESVKESLANLWFFIGERGDKGTIVMPVLGTGFARLKVPREGVIREAVRSFIAACAERVFCESLTIVVSPNDALKYSIDLTKLGDFITHVCQYTEYSPTREIQRGQGLPEDRIPERAIEVKIDTPETSANLSPQEQELLLAAAQQGGDHDEHGLAYEGVIYLLSVDQLAYDFCKVGARTFPEQPDAAAAAAYRDALSSLHKRGLIDQLSPEAYRNVSMNMRHPG